MATLASVLAREVYQRVRQKMTIRQCMYYLNHAQAIITSAGNFPWDLATATANPVVGTDSDTITVAQLDTGKKVACFSANGLPIVRIRQDEFNIAAANFLNVSTTIYSAFSLYQTATDPVLHFYPPIGAPPAVTYHYHRMPTTLTNAVASAPRWLNKDMDDLLCDFAEMEIKRILGAPDAATLEQRCIARLKEATTRFSIERENTGPQGDVLNAEAEKTQIGRV